MRASDEDAFFGTTRVNMVSSNGIDLAAADRTDANGTPVNPFAAPPPEPSLCEAQLDFAPSKPPPSALSALSSVQPSASAPPMSMKDILKARSSTADDGGSITMSMSATLPPKSSTPADSPIPRANSSGALSGGVRSSSPSGGHPAGLPPPPSGRLDIPPGAYVYTGPPLPPNALGRTQWLADETVPNCMRCGQEFDWWLRRHHCRQVPGTSLTLS